ncbi:ABC transporter permease, partial [Burkholderia multivorans]|uniref:hypothetical protein n=1 Tax=Burkholderia multivorans TaxID=87883 RepID=UPI000DB50477
VLASKCAVAATLVAGAAMVGVVGALLVAHFTLPGRGFTAATGYPGSSVFEDRTQRGAFGTVLYLVLITLL